MLRRPGAITPLLAKRWIRSEYLLKGAYLGLALLASTRLASATDMAVFAIANLATPLAVTFPRVLGDRRNSPRGQWAIRLFLAALDHPLPILLAVNLATLAVLVWVGSPILLMVGAGFAGALVGGLIHTLYRLPTRWRRRWTAVGVLIVVACVLVVLLAGSSLLPDLSTFGSISLLVAAVVLYGLTLFGRSEETDLDIALVALVVALALGSFHAPRTVRSMVVLVPVALYVIYAERMRKGIAVFKRIVRAMEYERVGKPKEALLEYRLALETDSRSTAAREGSWRTHSRIHTDDLASDPDLMSLIDPDACLERARALLPQASSQEKFLEAKQLLQIARRCDPALALSMDRAEVQLLLAADQPNEARRRAAQAADQHPPLAELSDRELGALFGLWMDLLQHPLLASTGLDLLDQRGRRPALIHVLTEVMRRDPRNADAPSLLSLAYRGLTHADFECFEPKASLNVKLLRQVALDVLHVEGDRPRACELFAVLFDAWPEARITTASALAEAHTDPVLSRAWLVQVREAARSRGFRQLDHDEQLALDDAVRVLAQDAIAEKDLPAALAHWEIFATSPASGIDTRRKLIDGYVEIGQLVRAVVHLEALLHFQLSTDERKRWTARKRELYRSITPVDLTPVLRDVESTFDFDACYRWASEAFDKHDDPAVVSHFLSLAELGGVRQLRFVNMLLGRQHFRAGDYEKSALCFEQVRARPPARFQNVDEEKIYFRACRLLGEIYVEHLNDPARAIEPLKLFKDHVDSGADTLFLLGRAYEQLGQIAQARKWYDLVLVYPSHPKAAAARDALARLARE